MNSRNNTSDDHELPSSSSTAAAAAAARVSARNRFSAPPAAAFTSTSTSNEYYGKKSKGGINGRNSHDDLDDDTDLGGLSSRAALRSAAKRPSLSTSTTASNSSSISTSNSNGIGNTYAMSRQLSSGSERPWRTNSTTASNSSAMYDIERSYSNESAGSVGSGNNQTRNSGCGGSGVEVVRTPSKNRWAQYETDDLAEESRKATSNAVVDMATRIADSQRAENDNEEEDEGSDNEDSNNNINMMPIMGGAVGSGYGHSNDEMLNRLESNGNSLPATSILGGSNNNSSSTTTDYVKSRLSKLLHTTTSNNNNNHSSTNNQNDHDKVRNEALKMLQIADNCLQSSPLHSPSGASPSSPSRDSSSNITTGLFRTKGGGLAMRELNDDTADGIITSPKVKVVSSIKGLDQFKNERGSKFDGSFAIDSYDEDDVARHKRTNSNGAPLSPNDDTPSLWSSRYSVERQLMAITGGLDSKHMLAKMDMLHSSREKTKSARGLYRASGYAMDGSHEEYNDYTHSSSTGVGLGSNIWLWFKGTLWSDDLELNYDGTTQSLVRREKAMQRRKRIRYTLAFLFLLSIAVGVTAHVGNKAMKAQQAKNVNFYVLADEPYDLSNLQWVTRELETLSPDEADFAIHLGNANGDEESMCQEYGFERAAAVLKKSRVPMLVIPGDLDWAACGDEDTAQQALSWWEIYLGKLERNWEHPLNVEYSENVVGNFAFLHKGVLFISVSIVDYLTAPNEVTTRLEQNVIWTKEQLSHFDKEAYHALVIFGHAPPSDRQGEYFWPIMEEIKNIDKPVLYLHANANGSFEQYSPFNEAENFMAVQLEKQGVEAPMKVVVKGNDKKRDTKDLFAFERREPSMESAEQ
ncbi:hypothetical protein ACHAWU_008639 [Discostella pseudostelligera]|uniref:Calcineurin-like phosphoesterase domain-containing protein n=1 Tax=Discostella pseudostelligera TaxID=259834 RepID=A0ABD3MEN7_9STRA